MKKLLLIGFCCFCLVGCGEKKEESNSSSNSENNPIVQAKKNCCTDTGGVWYNSDTCLAGSSGFFDREGYNSCVEYAVGSTN